MKLNSLNQANYQSQIQFKARIPFVSEVEKTTILSNLSAQGISAKAFGSEIRTEKDLVNYVKKTISDQHFEEEIGKSKAEFLNRVI